MVIIFHISISLFNFTFELSTEFKWGITARHRTNMPYIESFSRTFDQNGDTLSYLKGTGSRRRTPPRHILVFWPFFLSEFRCLFLFPANVELSVLNIHQWPSDWHTTRLAELKNVSNIK